MNDDARKCIRCGITRDSIVIMGKLCPACLPHEKCMITQISLQKNITNLEDRIKTLEERIDYYENFESFIDTYDPRIVSDAHEHLSQVK